MWAALVITLGYGFIGYLDDWLKLSKRNSKGLAGRYKLILQTFFFLVAVFGLMCTWTKLDGSLTWPHLLLDTQARSRFGLRVPKLLL